MQQRLIRANLKANNYPVCLSPMINSLCPLPIGTKLSTALIPVCIGSFTEIRGIIPGALTPTRARPSVFSGPYKFKLKTVKVYIFPDFILICYTYIT